MAFTHQLYLDCHCKSAVIMSLYNHNFAIIPPSESPGYPDTATASCSWMPLESATSSMVAATTNEVKPKRKRTAYNTNQLNALEEEYSKSQYLDKNRRQQLAAELDLTDRNVKIWFQNRRMKDKKEKGENCVTSTLGPVLYPDLTIPFIDQNLVPNEAVTPDWAPMPSNSIILCDYFGKCVVEERVKPFQSTAMQFAEQSPVVMYPQSDYRTAYINNVEYGYSTEVPQNLPSQQYIPSQETAIHSGFHEY